MTTFDRDLMATMDLLLMGAGKELMERFGSDVKPRTKGDQSIVTDADLASEAHIIENIKKMFPKDIILAEESGLSHQATVGQSVWIIDPLDGTTNYANRYPLFCVSIARGFYRGEGLYDLEVGGIYAPALQRTYIAEKGRGAFLNGKSIKISPFRPIQQAFLVTGFAYLKGPALAQEIGRFERVAENCSGIRRDGTAALDLAMVADGTFDAFWEYGLAPWDVAAGILMVSEAGGITANYDGRPYLFNQPGLISGCKDRVAELRELIKIES